MEIYLLRLLQSTEDALTVQSPNVASQEQKENKGKKVTFSVDARVKDDRKQLHRFYRSLWKDPSKAQENVTKTRQDLQQEEKQQDNTPSHQI